MGVLPGERFVVLSEDFGPWITRVRTGKGMTLVQLAKDMGVSVDTVTPLERGTRRNKALDVDILVRLAKGLDLDLGYVMHKAGFNVGASGVNLARLARVEAVVEALRASEPAVRKSLAEAAVLIDGSSTLDPAEVRADVSRALAAFDLITERLREEKI